MKKLRTGVLAALWPVLNGYAQESIDITPLTIGDTMPDIILENVINYPVSKIHLSTLKGKLVILDFWGKSCYSCIAAFPRMDSLQSLYKDRVQIITISDLTSRDDLIKVLGKYKATKHLRLVSSPFNEQLAHNFPYELVSHVIWINKNGMIATITGADYVTKEHIQELLNNDVVHWPVKKDKLNFDYRQSLLGLRSKDVPAPDFLYYSTLTANLSGISAPNGTFRDSTSGTATTLYYNATLLSLCEIALNHPPDGSISLDVQDVSRYKWTKEVLYSDWFRANTYSYALVVPIHLSKREINQAIQADLLRWLNVLGIRITTVKKKEAGKEVNAYIITDKR